MSAHHNEELVTDDMRVHTSKSATPTHPAVYRRAREIGRHITVEVIGTNQVICFYKNCQVVGSVGHLSPFHENDCERRHSDDATRDSWGSVTL